MKLKTLVPLVLALVMLFSFSVPALAAAPEKGPLERISEPEIS
jgi:hypothetical protein